MFEVRALSGKHAGRGKFGYTPTEGLYSMLILKTYLLLNGRVFE